MTVAFFIIAIGFWVLYSGWRLYRQVNWSEAPVYTPDLGAIRKKEAELLHVQDFLEEAHAQGKLSDSLMQEYHRFCDREMAQLHSEKLTSSSKK